MTLLQRGKSSEFSFSHILPALTTSLPLENSSSEIVNKCLVVIRATESRNNHQFESRIILISADKRFLKDKMLGCDVNGNGNNTDMSKRTPRPLHLKTTANDWHVVWNETNSKYRIREFSL